MEIEMDVKKIDKLETFYNILIIGGFIVFFVAMGFIINEVGGAYMFCKTHEGEYTLKIEKNASVNHACGNLSINRYSDGWDFDINRFPNHIFHFP